MRRRPARSAGAAQMTVSVGAAATFAASSRSSTDAFLADSDRDLWIRKDRCTRPIRHYTV